MAGGIEAGAVLRGCVFKAWRNLSLRCVQRFCKPGLAYRFPVGAGPGHEARRKKTRLLIVATSSGRLFLDRVARQHCPSPLHRHTQFNMHFSQAPAKGDISTLPPGGHFYFALTEVQILLDKLRMELPKQPPPRIKAPVNVAPIAALPTVAPLQFAG